MYRIELSPGEETAFRSIEELAVAVKRGVVTSRARIWHNASAKWLPIEFHPHYKIAAAMQLTTADLVAGPPVQKLELLTLGAPMDPPAPPPPVRPVVQPEPAAPPPRAKRTPEPDPKPRKKAAAKARRTKSGRRPIRIALLGALVIAGAHLAFSAASSALPEDTAIRPWTNRHLIPAPNTTAQQGRPETTAAAVLPGLPSVSRPEVRPAAPLPTESAAATPPLGAFRAETGIQPAPASDIAAPIPASSDSLTRKMVDSTGKKALKRILRTIGGTPAEKPRTKR